MESYNQHSLTNCPASSPACSTHSIMKTAVIYARYSSERQTEQSIEGQLRICNDYAKRNDIVIVGTYIDRAMSGTNDNRADFQRMLKDSNKKNWNMVLVYKFDRFSRNKFEMAMHKKTLKDNGIKLVSACENIPEGPEGIILESLLEGMAEYYSAELSQKVLRGLNESYIKGQFTGGYIQYGYYVKDKKVYIDENEAPIVKEIFTRFASGETGKSIGDNLVARGIRTKDNYYVNEKKVYKIIGDSKYTGKVVHNGKTYTNIYPQIIDDETWQKVQYIRDGNKHKIGAKKQKFNFLLSGKLICGDCGSFLVGESGTSKTGEIHKYYTCLTRRRRKQPCKLKSISKTWLENEVFTKTWELLNDFNNMEEIVDRIYNLHQQNTQESEVIKALEKKKNDATKASSNLISALEQGFLTEQTKSRLKELENEIAQLDFDIDQAKQRNYSNLTKEDIRNYLQKAILGDINDFETRKLIARKFIRQVIIYNDKIIITYNITDKDLPKKTKLENITEIENAIKQEEQPAFNINLCSYKQSFSQPVEKQGLMALLFC